jgi:hypothetical protein
LPITMLIRLRNSFQKFSKKPMSKTLSGCILLMFMVGCTADPSPTVVPVETVVVAQLTKLAAQDPTEEIIQVISTLPAPAVGAPTQMATATGQPLPTLQSFTLAPLPTLVRKPKITATVDPNSNEKSITYSITGTAEAVEITFINPDGKVENGPNTLPFEKTMVFKKGAPLSLFAKIANSGGSVTCKIFSADKVIIEVSEAGINKTAFCSDVTAE